MSSLFFKRLFDLSRPKEMADLEAWRERVTTRLNTLEGTAAGTADNNFGSLQKDFFTADGSTDDFVLSKRVAIGAVALVLVPQALAPSACVVQAYSGSQDKVHLTYTPRADQQISVIYPVRS